jgi:hypothetical protein
MSRFKSGGRGTMFPIPPPGSPHYIPGWPSRDFIGSAAVPAGWRALIPDTSWDERGDSVRVDGPATLTLLSPGIAESLAVWEIKGAVSYF